MHGYGIGKGRHSLTHKGSIAACWLQLLLGVWEVPGLKVSIHDCHLTWLFIGQSFDSALIFVCEARCFFSVFISVYPDDVFGIKPKLVAVCCKQNEFFFTSKLCRLDYKKEPFVLRFFSFGAAAQRWPGPPHSRGF